jgi:hypothetical protein
MKKCSKNQGFNLKNPPIGQRVMVEFVSANPTGPTPPPPQQNLTHRFKKRCF